MVLRFYHRPAQDVRQCSLANAFFLRNDCCNNPVPGQCNVGINEIDVVNIYANNQVTATQQGRRLSFTELRNEIQAERPVETKYQWNGGGAHVVIVRGYRETRTDQFVTVNDPWPFYQSGDLPLQVFETANGKGSWVETWTLLDRSRS